MSKHYGYLTKKNKLIIGAIALVLGVLCGMYFNSDYLQANMYGQWVVTNADVRYEVASVPEQVEISSRKIKINEEEHPINYWSRSSDANFFRRDIEGSIMYYFEEDDYILSYDKKNPDMLVLLTLPTREEYNGAAYNFYLLEKKED